MADQKAVVTLKDGTKIVLDNEADIQKYSDRDDLDSISFFGGDDTADAGVQEQADAGVVAVVEQPKADPVVAKPQPVGDHATAITATIGALAGAVSSAGTPALMNLAKSFIKGKLKLNAKGGEQSRPEDEKEEPTDCKTHQIKAGAKFASISARITALENRPVSSGSDDELDFDSDDVEELKEKVKKLEKMVKDLQQKKKKNV
jgi:hypothetical protein